MLHRYSGCGKKSGDIMGLDRFQEKAVTFPLDKSLFVTAPPGYDKTHVLRKD